MAFTVETGAGLSNANSYASYAEATTYFTDRGRTALATTAQASVEQALIAATDYLDAKFSFVGSRSSPTQALSWPRSGASDSEEGYTIASNAIPAAIKRATIELASKILEGAVLSLIQDLDRGGQISSVKVGPLSVTYADGASPDTVYGIVGLLKGLIESTEPGAQLQVFAEEAGADTAFGFTPGLFDNNG